MQLKIMPLWKSTTLQLVFFVFLLPLLLFSKRNIYEEILSVVVIYVFQRPYCDKSFSNAGESLQEVVLKEFEGLYSELVERAGISVSVFSHSSSHNTPDAVFPNNWFSTHNGKTLCLYPMKVE